MLNENIFIYYIKCNMTKAVILILLFIIQLNCYSQITHKEYTQYIKKYGLNIIWEDKNNDGKIQLHELKYNDNASSQILKSHWIRIEGWQKLQDKINQTKIFDSSKNDNNFIGKITCIDISREGRYIAGGTESGVIKIFDIKSGNIVFDCTNQFKDKILSIKFIPYSNNIAVVSKDKSIKIFNIKNDESPIYTDKYEKHFLKPNILKVSNNGQFIVTATEIINVYIKAFEDTWEKIITTNRSPNIKVNDIAISNDNKWLVAAMADNKNPKKNNYLELFSLREGALKIEKSIDNHQSDIITSVLFSHKTESVFTGALDGIIKGYMIEWDDIITKPFFISDKSSNNPIYCIDMSYNDALIAEGTENGSVKIYNIENNKLILNLNKYFSTSVIGIQFFNDNKSLIVLCKDHRVAIIDYKANIIYFNLDDNKEYNNYSQTSIALTDNGTLFARGTDDKIEVYKVEEFNLTKNMEVFVDIEAYNQVLAIFNTFFNGLKDGDIIYFFQTDFSKMGLPVYHVRLRLRNDIYMLVRTTVNTDEYDYLFDEVMYENDKKLSVNIIIADSDEEFDKGITDKGDWNNRSGIILKPDSDLVKKIADR